MSEDQVYGGWETQQALDRDVELRSMTPKQKLIDAIMEEIRSEDISSNQRAYCQGLNTAIKLIEEILPE